MQIPQSLLPKNLGPIFLPGTGGHAINLAVAMEYSHVYPDQIGALGEPTEDWLAWALDGWNDTVSKYVRKRKSENALFIMWDGKKYKREEAWELAFSKVYIKHVRKKPDYTELVHQYFINDRNIGFESDDEDVVKTLLNMIKEEK